jgi:hypothetical protein
VNCILSACISTSYSSTALARRAGARPMADGRAIASKQAGIKYV